MTIGAHPSSLGECCLPNKSHQSLILPLVLYQTVFKLPLEISHIESIIGIPTPIPCSQLLQLMNFCYHHVYSSVPLTPRADCLHLACKSMNPLLFSLSPLWSPCCSPSLPFSSRLCLAFQGSRQRCVGRHLQPQRLRCPGGRAWRHSSVPELLRANVCRHHGTVCVREALRFCIPGCFGRGIAKSPSALAYWAPFSKEGHSFGVK